MASVVVVLALATALFWLGLVIYFLKGSRASERRPALRGTRVAYKQGDKVKTGTAIRASSFAMFVVDDDVADVGGWPVYGNRRAEWRRKDELRLVEEQR